MTPAQSGAEPGRQTPSPRSRTAFDGGVALITGAASGIGAALATSLAAKGCTVILADLQIDLAAKVARDILASGGKAQASELDVADFESVSNLVSEVVERHGKLNYMFNNAGIAIGGEADRYEIADWTRIINVNLLGVVNGVQAAYRVMCDQGFGHIVNTASVAGLLPLPTSVNYATAKHAIVGLSTSLRVAAESHSVRVSVLCPGVVETPMLTGGRFGKIADNTTVEAVSAQMRSRRPISPDEFVKRALPQIASNKAIIVVPTFYRIGWWIYRMRPSWGLALTRKDYLSQVADLDET